MNYKFYLLSISILLSIHLSAGGLSAWHEKTPYGHEIDHDGTAGGWISLSLDTTSVAFQYFYFYKGHTIAHSDLSYFIINEQNQDIQTFRNEKQWRKALKEQHLVPNWEREYNDNYGTDKAWIILIFFLAPLPFLLPLLWVVSVISLVFPSKWWYKIRVHFAWIYPALIILVILLGDFPQSI